MTTFLFWNLYKKSLHELVANLASQRDIDIILLAECTTPPNVFLKELNRNGQATYHYIPNVGLTKIEIFSRFPSEFLQPAGGESRINIRHLKLPGLTDILLVGVHFYSKPHIREEEGRIVMWLKLAESITQAEETVGHSRTVLVGDFNMNPFENGMVNAYGFHGVMSREIARKGSRVINQKKYSFFYNPMWSLFGDATSGPPGTCYFNDSTASLYFWNIFDQVLVRPDLLSNFANDDLEIVTSDGQTLFVTENGLPDKKKMSDHLPIVFKLSL